LIDAILGSGQVRRAGKDGEFDEFTAIFEGAE